MTPADDAGHWTLVDSLQKRVTERLEASGPARDGDGAARPGGRDERDAARPMVAAELTRYAQEEFRHGRPPMPVELERRLIEDVLDVLYGLGRLQRLVDDPDIENINLNGFDRGFVKFATGRKAPIPHPVAQSDDDLIRLIRQAAVHLSPSERRFDHASPLLDMLLPGGHRLSAVMSVARRPAVSIRRHRLLDPEKATLAELRDLGMFDIGLEAFLRAAVKARRTIVIGGGTNAGKTTLLRALANEIPQHERLVTIEKSFELGLDEFTEKHPDVVALEARDANTEGEGGIGMSDLVRRGLRMDPDRVIVGEVLGDEVLDMLNAISQGNEGSLCTIHANSAEGVFRRIATYAIQSAERVAPEATAMLVAGSVHYVVFIDQLDRRTEPGGRLERFVGSVHEVTGASGSRVESKAVFGPRRSDRRAEPRCRPAAFDELVTHGCPADLFGETTTA